MLCWFLPYNKVNQPEAYIYPLCLEPPFHTHPCSAPFNKLHWPNNLLQLFLVPVNFSFEILVLLVVGLKLYI